MTRINNQVFVVDVDVFVVVVVVIVVAVVVLIGVHFLDRGF